MVPRKRIPGIQTRDSVTPHIYDGYANTRSMGLCVVTKLGGDPTLRNEPADAVVRGLSAHRYSVMWEVACFL